MLTITSSGLPIVTFFVSFSCLLFLHKKSLILATADIGVNFERNMGVVVKINKLLNFSKIVIFTSVFMLLSGCAAVSSRMPVEQPPAGVRAENPPAIYKGTYVDIVGPAKFFTDDGPFTSLLLLIDLPFSFIVDTLLLPYDIYQSIKLEKAPGQTENDP